MVRIGILGCGGRMGRMLLAEILAGEGMELAGGVDRPASEAIGRDLGTLAGRGRLGLIAGDDPAALFPRCQVAIDFSVPAATVVHAGLAAAAGCALVIGTTGLAPPQQAAIAEAARTIPVMQAANMSAGVTLMLALVERTAKALDAGYDIEILDMHHRHKVDAPSGTALALGRAAAAGRGIDLAQSGRLSRQGQVGARAQGEIGFAALRGGDVVGDHLVIFAGDGERIEIAHRASSRLVFAAGALRAARWIVGQPPGLYDMTHVLGLANG